MAWSNVQSDRHPGEGRGPSSVMRWTTNLDPGLRREDGWEQNAIRPDLSNNVVDASESAKRLWARRVSMQGSSDEQRTQGRNAMSKDVTLARRAANVCGHPD